MIDIVLLDKLTKDIKEASITLTRKEARYIVKLYYILQEYRKASGNQIKALSESGEPHETLKFLFSNARKLEAATKAVLDAYTDGLMTGQWVKSLYGFGPVISAGLIAHIDMDTAVTVAKIWRYAGLDPTVKWKKGEKRPWNADLKTLCFKIGDCIVKFKNKDGVNHPYGKLYDYKKAIETERNEKGELAEQARAILKEKNIGKDTVAYQYYSKGLLPPAHIDMRAKRWVVKIFLSHWHTVAYYEKYGKLPPKPWIIVHGGHTDYIPVPNWGYDK